MILGAGEMSELTAKHLMEQGVSSVLVANRTFTRAQALADQFGGRAVKFDDRHEEMVKADIVVSSTAAPHYVINKNDLKYVMKRRRNRPICIIDISVPRDVDPEVNKLDNVYLYDVDDLEKVVESNKADRMKAAKLGEGIIDEEKNQFLHWLSSLEVTPTIAQLKEKAEKIREEELEKIINRLHDISDQDLERVKALTNVLMNRILHEPIINLKELTKQKDGYEHIEALRYFFGLNNKETEPKKEKVEK
jgi:glutamyl-tRNA reductase